MKIRKIILILIVTIALLSIAPLVYAVTETLSDSFNLTDSIRILAGILQTGLKDIFNLRETIKVVIGIFNKLQDSFKLIDSIQVSVTQCNTCNPFTTLSTTNAVTAVDTLNNQIITGIVFPIFYMMGVLYFGAVRLKIKEFPILLGLSVFVFMGLIYINVIPSWAVIFPIIFGAVATSLVVSKWLGARGTAES